MNSRVISLHSESFAAKQARQQWWLRTNEIFQSKHRRIQPLGVTEVENNENPPESDTENRGCLNNGDVESGAHSNTNEGNSPKPRGKRWSILRRHAEHSRVGIALSEQGAQNPAIANPQQVRIDVMHYCDVYVPAVQECGC